MRAEFYNHSVATPVAGIQLSDSAGAMQAHLLEGVSRTFALTIPQLPAGLYDAVANGYLLCRIVDTIEDDPALSAEQKREFATLFTQVVAGEAPATTFADGLAPLLSEATIPAEHELIQKTPEVIDITLGFSTAQRDALSTCVRTMAEGMVRFQETDTHAGLIDLAEMEAYCYYVAGVVGEMLTRLYCEYSEEIARDRERLMQLSVRFGQGLQMTNILKDIWDDKKRGACWLPRDVFQRHGFDLAELTPDHHDPRFAKGLEDLIGVAYQCLQDALEYTLLIPSHETGIRNFCLWAIGMAELTLRKINQRKDFSAGEQVKISRRSVKTTVFASRMAVRYNSLLRLLFRFAGWGLPRASAVVSPGGA